MLSMMHTSRKALSSKTVSSRVGSAYVAPSLLTPLGAHRNEHEAGTWADAEGDEPLPLLASGSAFAQIQAVVLGKAALVEVSAVTSGAELKRILEHRTGIPVDYLGGLYFASRPIADERSLASYGIGKDSLVEVKPRLRGGAVEAADLAARQMGLLPRFFHTLATTHPRPHGAFKDLIANARDAKATLFSIDVDTLYGITVMRTVDNGPGPCLHGAPVPTLESFQKMLDLGHSTSANSSDTAGEAGQGAKSGPLGIAKDVVVATAGEGCYLVALLSASLHESLEADPAARCVVPYLVYSRQTSAWTESPGAFRHFDQWTGFRSEEGRETLRQWCASHLSETGGGLMHVFHKMRDGINERDERDDVLLPEGDDRSFPVSLRTYLSAAFYDKRFDGGRAFRIAIKGSTVAPFSKTRDLHPADCWRDRQWTLQGNNDRSLTIKFSVGWSAEEDAGSADNCAGDNARPFGFCVCNAGMMYSTFDKFKRMRKGHKLSVPVRMKTNLHGLIVLAEIERPDGFTLRDAGLLVHSTKEGFELNDVYIRLRNKAEKLGQDYAKSFFLDSASPGTEQQSDADEADGSATPAPSGRGRAGRASGGRGRASGGRARGRADNSAASEPASSSASSSSSSAAAAARERAVAAEREQAAAAAAVAARESEARAERARRAEARAEQPSTGQAGCGDGGVNAQAVTEAAGGGAATGRRRRREHSSPQASQASQQASRRRRTIATVQVAAVVSEGEDLGSAVRTLRAIAGGNREKALDLVRTWEQQTADQQPRPQLADALSLLETVLREAGAAVAMI